LPINLKPLLRMLNPITLNQFKAMYELDNFNTYDRDLPPTDKEDEDEPFCEDREMEDLIDPDNEN